MADDGFNSLNIGFIQMTIEKCAAPYNLKHVKMKNKKYFPFAFFGITLGLSVHAL